MLFALAVLLIQPQIAPQISLSAKEIAMIEPLSEETSGFTSPAHMSLPLPVSESENLVQPASPTDTAAVPNASEAAPVTAPVSIAFLKPVKPGTISVDELRAEQRRKERVWMGLGVAAHSAATFDAWSTRRAISTYGAQELNPILRPFAGNASLYAAIQVGPALMDYVGKRMMYSRKNFVRRLWWIPQSASFASSLFCGAHNVVVR